MKILSMPVLGTAMDASVRRTRRMRWAVVGLTVALSVLGWSVWKTQWAWRAGYGDQPMTAITQADLRALSGGDMTTFHKAFAPFQQSPDNLPWQYERIFDEGDGIFDKAFTPGDGHVAEDLKQDVDGMRRVGVGPLFNADGCARCHFRDGRVAQPYVSGGEMTGMFFRVSVPDGKGGWRAPPGYHSQLRDRAVDGVAPEAKGHIDWEEIGGRFPDGEAYTLRRPHYRIDHLGYGPLPADVVVEARSAPAVSGVGLLEAIDEKEILSRVPLVENADPDGISGRPNWITDPETGRKVLGRFSLKSNEPNVRAQAAAAAFNDMGVTSSLHPEQLCLPNQTACARAPHGGTPQSPELNDRLLQSLTTYLQLLAVPARRGLDDPVALRGERLFAEMRCAACHVPQMQTGDTHPIARLRHQTIHPYTDLLLHDMGPGLAGRPDGEATATEWRTSPLWGIGLTQRANHHSMFLHDQRARGFQEAILWHGGEAEVAKQRYVNLSKADRDALVRFLETL